MREEEVELLVILVLLGSYSMVRKPSSIHKQKRSVLVGFFGLFKDCFSYTVAIPKEAPTYSADFAGLQNAFQGVVQGWVEQFQNEFDTLSKKTSDKVSTQAQEQVNGALSQPKAQLHHLIEASKRSLQESKDNIKFLERKKQNKNLTYWKASFKHFCTGISRN